MHGPIHYLKGTLLSADCAAAPAATLSVRAGGKTWKILTSDYQKMALIGAAQFSCHHSSLVPAGTSTWNTE